MIIKKVGTESIPVIQHLAHVIWPSAYSSILAPDEIKYKLNLFYNHASLLQQMSDGHQFILVFEKDEAIAFASYSPKIKNDSQIYRLHKIYIHPSQQGKGIGKSLIDFIVNDIKPKGATGLELNVDRQNKAIHFYQKMGFFIVKEEDNDIGNGYFMNDYVMLKQLNLQHNQS